MHPCKYYFLIRRALAEDLGRAGDLSSKGLFSRSEQCTYTLVAKDDGVLCGMEIFSAVFMALNRRIHVEAFFKDGDRLSIGDKVARIQGPTRSILSGERTALNFLSHLSGVATKAALFSQATGTDGPAVLDTRKTIPGLRSLQKYAVSVGGGRNHRMGLYDMIMLKDNHIDAAGGIREAVARTRAKWGTRYKVEVETRTLDEVREALECGADRIMLDNMDDATMLKAVAIIDGRTETEGSGNMSLERLRGLAGSGLDFVSFGELTHTVRAFDFSLRKEDKP